MSSSRKSDEMIIDAVQRRFGRGKQFRIDRTVSDFLSGEIVAIEEVKEEEIVGKSYAYVSNWSDNISTFSSTDELLRWAGEQAKGDPRQRSILRSIEVSALIAVMVTITICGLISFQIFRGVNFQELVVPDILSNSLTTILGFYFGSKVAGARAEARDKPTVQPPKD